MRKEALALSIQTKTGFDFYLNMTLREFFEVDHEVAELWQAVKNSNSQSR